MDEAGLEAVLRQQDLLLTRAQARQAGLSREALRHRLRRGGPWQRVTSGVLAAFSGELTERQRMRAALLHGGESAMLGGLTAVLHHGMRYVPPSGKVHVLVAHQQHRSSSAFVIVKRTHELPRGVLRDGLLTAPLPRAAVDACRDLRDLRSVRALLAETVQRRRVRVEDLRRELERGETAGSALARTVLEEVTAGVRSAPEAELRELFAASTVLKPAVWNRSLYLGSDWLGDPDGYFPDAGLVVESDSLQWHSGTEAYEQTMARHGRFERVGLHVLHITPRRRRERPDAVLADVEATYVAALRSGPPPGLRVVRRAA